MTKMRVEHFAIDGPAVIITEKYADERGFFSETYNKQALAEVGITKDFVQDNYSHSAQAGVIRGLHFQVTPRAQGKLVRVFRGAVLDVIVDLRSGSSSYGQYLVVELSAENWKQLWVPEGFAHAFCTLSDDVTFAYKVTEHYSREHERGLAFDDPDLAIPWPIDITQAILSQKDRHYLPLKDLPKYF